MVVAKDRWSGDTRHVEQIAELRDVSVVSAPAYPAAAVEYRSAPKPITEEETKVEAEEKVEERATASSEEEKQPEVRVTNEPEPILQVEDRSGGPMFESLTDAFRQRGFPGETATISWGEFRAACFAGTIPSLNPIYRDGIPLGADQRYAFPAFRQVAVDSATTSVQVLRQTVRTLPAGTAVVRAIDAVTAKPEVTTTTDVATMELKQIAAVETNVPNIVLGQDMIQSLVETDLRLSVNEGLDQLVATGLATSGTMSAGTLDILTNVRKAITTVTAAGYVPSDLIIDPAGAEAIDLFRSSGSERFFTFGAGRFAPGELFGLNVRVSKTAGTAVVDSASFGKLYVSPINLARFEQDAGSTNKSTVRMEGHAVFGTERTTAAVRINP